MIDMDDDIRRSIDESLKRKHGNFVHSSVTTRRSGLAMAGWYRSKFQSERAK